MGRDAALAFTRLAKRHVEKDPDGDSIDVAKLNEAIRTAFVGIFIVRGKPWDEQKWIDRMLNRAAREAKRAHKERTHYVPCVILYNGHPTEFEIGPVRFVTKDRFFTDYGEKIKLDHEENRVKQRLKLDEMIAEGKYRAEDKKREEESKEIEQKILAWITDYYGAFTWIAEVTVPPCSAKVSRERAEITVQAALDVLKLFFGYRGGKDFRLGHHRGERDRTAHLTRGPDGVFHYSLWRGGEGGSAEEGWYEHVKENTSWALQAAGSAVEAYLQPRKVKSQHRDRWLGALHWYGQAVSEREPSAQLVKYVAALERLTVLEETGTVDEEGTQDVTDVVTRRTALLASETGDRAEVMTLRENARTLYRWRSNLMHGRSSPLTKELLEVMHLAHRMTQQAMFAALAIYVQLDMAGKLKEQDLEDRFVELEKEAFSPTEDGTIT